MPGIQVVVLVSRKYVDVVVPDVLVARRFVVLPGRDAVAAVGFTNCNSHGLNQVENRVPDARGQSVEILEVLDRRHKYVAGGVARPPLRGGNPSDCVVGSSNQVGRRVVLVELAQREATERAPVPRRLMMQLACLHVAIFPRPQRLQPVRKAPKCPICANFPPKTKVRLPILK